MIRNNKKIRRDCYGGILENSFRNRYLVGFLIVLIIFCIFCFNDKLKENVYAAEDTSSSGGEIHAFYPAYAVFSEQVKAYIDQVDSVSFAWSRLEADNPGALNTVKGQNGNKSFYYPADYLMPVEYAKSAGKSIQLSIYMSGADCVKLLPDSGSRELMLQAITEALQKDITSGEGIYYDGVVIDFEGLRDTDGSNNPLFYDGNQISTYFTMFLTSLKQQLEGMGKHLYVAVNPRLYYNGYDYSQILKIADRVILMAHDYEPSEKLQKNQVLQYTGYNAVNPINSMAPVPMVRNALSDLADSASDSSELSKVWLQICFDSAQWKYTLEGADGWNDLEKSTLSNGERVTPLYSTIHDRVNNVDGKAQNISHGYNNELQTPYIQYYNISDHTWNIILYEDRNSINAKIEQAEAYGIGGISIWSLSNVPDYTDAKGLEYHLDGWASIMDAMADFDAQTSGSSVEFKDPAVEQAVREKLGKPDGDITESDLQDVYRLKLPSGVKSLEDLKNLKQLEYLDAGKLALKDISAIKNLTNLRVLYLNRNEITDITPLKKLTHLEVLSLNGNQLTSITALTALTNLHELYLMENKIKDITPLEKMTKLNTLELGYNNISQLKAIGSLKSLRELSLENNQISDIKALKALTGLNALDLSNNKISDIQYLSKLTKLKKLYLQRNGIRSITYLSGLKQITELSLNGNLISELKPLAKLATLEKLYLKDNKITRITSLKGLKNLKELYLSGNKISDYSPVNGIYSGLQGNCDFIIS